MLALKITRRFEAALQRTFGSTEDDPAAITPDDALVALGRLTYLYTTDRNGQRHTHLPRPDDQQAKILERHRPVLPAQGQSRQARRVGRRRFCGIGYFFNKNR
jgi:hypothetical protein